MAKITHPNFVDTINDILTEAKARGVLQLEFEGESWKGSHVKIDGREMGNFGTCGYLGLELHPKVIQGAIDYAQSYGVQFSVSRTYLVSRKNYELEEHLSQIFMGKPVIAFTSTTMAHLSVLPIVVGVNDAILLDQQSHISIQNAAQLMVPKGVPIDIIRHSNLEMLEHKMKSIYDKYDRIWYMIDGVYSMYGDVAPIEEINQLMAKYPKLYLYVDDAHGMSWFGENGCGRLFKSTLENDRTIYITTMAKGYGTMGGISVFPDKSWYDKLILHGGPLAYSHPIPPPMMGAAMAAAKIHLSPEIYELQASLKEKLDCANTLFAKTDIPILSYPETPIYFVGTGQPIVGYNLNKRIIDEGFYINIGMFPAVPVKNTGLRFTITNHNSLDQIKAFVEAIIYHYPKALEEESKTLNDVKKAFRLTTTPTAEPEKKEKKDEHLSVQLYTSIEDIPREVWDEFFADKGNFDWDALTVMENGFQGNELPEENWKFYYILVRDANNKVILATFFTCGLFKDDLLSPADVSRAVEQKRMEDKYFLCSETLCMGSLFTEGDHLYVDKSHPEWKKAVTLMLDSIHQVQEKNNINSLILRDFEDSETELTDIFHEAGFFKINMPNANTIEGLSASNSENFVEQLSPRSRRHVRNDVVKLQHLFHVEVVPKLEEEELKQAYKMYKNVGANNFALNIFSYPYNLFSTINEATDWEFIKLLVKEDNDKETFAAVGISHISKTCYTPVLVGIDYSKNAKYNCYKQMLFQVCLRAMELNLSTINFGLSADVEKKKLGARQVSKYAYLEVRDNYNLEVLDKFL